jgi:hypothetical protein
MCYSPSVLDLQRTIGNQAVLRLLRQSAGRHHDPAPVPPAQAGASCACGGKCPLCSHEEHEREALRSSDRALRSSEQALRSSEQALRSSEHALRSSEQALPVPAQDDLEFFDFENQTETPEPGVVPPDIGSPAERTVMTDAAPPLESGWFTGDWYKSSNTIICDGSGSLTIHEATSYKYGVQDCTRKHENSHKGDWYARYGNDICKGRKKGDLPNFTPKGKEAYADFVKASECTAWKIGQTCRNEALAACKDDECKNYVKTYTTQADSEVKNYCG